MQDRGFLRTSLRLVGYLILDTGIGALTGVATSIVLLNILTVLGCLKWGEPIRFEVIPSLCFVLAPIAGAAGGLWAALLWPMFPMTQFARGWPQVLAMSRRVVGGTVFGLIAGVADVFVEYYPAMVQAGTSIRTNDVWLPAMVGGVVFPAGILAGIATCIVVTIQMKRKPL